jgi:DNA polymerase III delta subunit
VRDERERRPTRSGVSSPRLSEIVRAAGGEIVLCVSPTTGELAPWLDAHAARVGIALEPGVTSLIATRVGAEARELDIDRATMRASAVREIEKLASGASGTPISLAAADALVVDRAGGSIFAFLDAIVMRDPVAIARHLARASDEPGWKIVGSLHRRIRELMIIRALLRSGHSVASASERSGINEWAAKTLATAAGRWETRELGSALEGVLEIDRAAAAGEGPRRLALAVWSSELAR